MADDGLVPLDLTGRWVGFYRHRWEQLGTFPIHADIHQDGDRISGEMYDQITDRSNLLDRLYEVCREDIPLIQRQRVEAAIERFGTEAVVVSSRLPETSDITGKVFGGMVEFTKAYRGSCEVNWSVEGKEVGSVERKRHNVHYSGHMDRERRYIAGEWVIRRSGLLGRFLTPVDRGTFELYMKS